MGMEVKGEEGWGVGIAVDDAVAVALPVGAGERGGKEEAEAEGMERRRELEMGKVKEGREVQALEEAPPGILE